MILSAEAPYENRKEKLFGWHQIDYSITASKNFYLNSSSLNLGRITRFVTVRLSIRLFTITKPNFPCFFGDEFYRL